jgi:2-phosphosulfolactate phosphatase
LFRNQDAVVVVIDIFRATSAICTALHHGVEAIIPVSTVEEAQDYKSKGYLAAAERHGEIVEGFELGNSPFSYMGHAVKGKTIVLTTTNGTQAIQASKDAHRVVVGSFCNFTVLANWLIEQNRDVVLLCAGWKNKFNLEDTLFAGAVAEKLFATGNFVNSCDTAQAACQLYSAAKNDLFGFLENSSHRKRLERLNLEKDIRYCLQLDNAPVIPILEGISLVNLKLRVTMEQ